MSNWSGAADRCSKALALEPENVKALFRRGVAYTVYTELQRFADAKADLVCARASSSPSRARFGSSSRGRRSRTQRPGVPNKECVRRSVASCLLKCERAENTEES